MPREYEDRSVNIWPSGRQSCVNFLTKPGSIDSELDIIEFAFKVIDEKIRNYAGVGYYGIIMTPDESPNLITGLGREASVISYENGVMIRMDSQFVHAEITKKALSLLSSQQFSGAEDEFLSAHKHYREGDHKDAIVDAGASFESTMKCICDALGWTYDKKSQSF